MSAKTCSVIAAVATAVVLIPTATVAQSGLSQAQQGVIAKKIGSTSATEKKMVAEWDLTFDCLLDPEKAVVTSFSYKMK